MNRHERRKAAALARREKRTAPTGDEALAMLAAAMRRETEAQRMLADLMRSPRNEPVDIDLGWYIPRQGGRP